MILTITLCRPIRLHGFGKTGKQGILTDSVPACIGDSDRLISELTQIAHFLSHPLLKTVRANTMIRKELPPYYSKYENDYKVVENPGPQGQNT